MNGKKSAGRGREFLTTFDLHELIADTSKYRGLFLLISFCSIGSISENTLQTTSSSSSSALTVPLCISFIGSLIHFSRLIFSHLTFSQSKISRFLRRSSCRSLYSLYISPSLSHIARAFIVCDFLIAIFFLFPKQFLV